MVAVLVTGVSGSGTSTALAELARRGFRRSGAEREWVLADVAAVEPLLRASADAEIDTRAPVAQVAERLVGIARTAAASGRRSP